MALGLLQLSLPAGTACSGPHAHYTDTTDEMCCWVPTLGEIFDTTHQWAVYQNQHAGPLAHNF